MGTLSSDPIQATINGSIKRGISLLMDAECFGPADALSYSAIDTMAYLAMPESRSDVKPADFHLWCKRYLYFCGPNPRTQISAEDLYSARCAMVHHFGVVSKMVRNKHARWIGYFVEEAPTREAFMVYNPNVPEAVMLSIPALVNAVKEGIDGCLIDLFADPSRRALVEQRLTNIVVAQPFTPTPPKT